MHSLVIPVFNEALNLPTLFGRIQKVINQVSEPFEVILVNDGSSDGSDKILDGIHAADARFKIIHFSRNFGHQIAVTAGIEYAVGDTVSVLDADLQDPPEVILDFLAKWREGFEVVFGVRRSRRGETLFKLWTAKIFYRLIRRLTRLDIPVDTGDFRLLDRKVANAFLSLRERNRYIRGLISWVGFKQTGVLYDREERLRGTTNYTFSKMLKLAFDAVSSFSIIPLRLATLVGFLASAAALLVVVWALYLRVFTDKTIQGWTSQILVMLFLGGAQLFCLGLMGEYLGRTFDETRRRPLYLVTRLTGFPRRDQNETSKAA